VIDVLTESGSFILAESDWQTIAAIVVFTLISVIANWVKKRSETAQQPRPGTAVDDEFEPVELFEEPRPLPRSAPVARPTALPKPAKPPRPREPKGKPVSASEHTQETAVRISSIVRTPKESAARPGVRAIQPIKIQRPAPATIEVESSPGVGELLPLRNPRNLRQAIIAAEILRPPLALRVASELPGLSH
jgi:hypothetical protein